MAKSESRESRGPKICGQLDLKTVLLVIIGFGVLVSIVGIVTGSLIVGIVSLVVNLYGLYAVWYEQPLHVKIFGIIKFIWLLVANILDIVGFARYGVTAGALVVLLIIDVIDILILYGLYVFYQGIGGRGTVSA
ncbi:hypothetical protein HDV01_002677 [Terramyces sp. JEL0728]|nr:hypothetical protein HDV01_002677 [Terramyces sp. JEL0728]